MKGLHQGERLLLLANRSGMGRFEISQRLNISLGHLSRLFKSEILTIKIKKAACALFNVDLSFFDFAELDNDTYYDADITLPAELEKMSASDVINFIEEKDRRQHEERVRLLNIIENLTKK